MTESAERRRHTRYPVQRKAYALLKIQESKLGRIVNISKGGLAFRYMTARKRLKDTLDIDIMITDNGFRLDNIRVRIISEHEVADEGPFSFLKIRQLGVEFADLSQEQDARLDYFIQKYVVA
jgi:c-di-GMP-binding flagellar brake protein YcgR